MPTCTLQRAPDRAASRGPGDAASPVPARRPGTTTRTSERASQSSACLSHDTLPATGRRRACGDRVWPTGGLLRWVEREATCRLALGWDGSQQRGHDNSDDPEQTGSTHGINQRSPYTVASAFKDGYLGPTPHPGSHLPVGCPPARTRPPCHPACPSRPQVFVANPNKPQPIVDILTNNRDRLLKYLEDFHTEKGGCRSMWHEPGGAPGRTRLPGQQPTCIASLRRHHVEPSVPRRS